MRRGLPPWRFCLAGGALCLGASGCGEARPAVVVYSSVDQVFSEPVLRAFESKTGIAVKAVFDTEETKSTGILNRLIAEAGRPQADVFWSGDPVRPFLLIDRGLVQPYLSPAAARIPRGFKAEDGSWCGLAARARVLLVNDKLVPERESPRSIRDLAAPRFRGRTAIASPLYGTTTIHVAALSAAWGEKEARAFLDSLKANAVRVAGSNGEVKRLVVAGEIAFGLTDTDDADAALKEKAPVRVVYPDQDGDGTLVMPTAVVVIRGGPHAAAGAKLVDFLLSEEVERRLAEAAAHMPLGSGVPVPAGVKRLEEIRAMPVDFAKVAAEVEKVQPWLRRWVGL